MFEKASIKFLKRSPLYDVERPFQIFMNLPPEAPDQRKTNLVWDEKDILVHDFRGNDDFQLDKSGFTARKMPGFTDLYEEKVITEEYLPAVRKMLETELEGCGTVFIFDWRLRSSQITLPSDTINFNDQTQLLLPSNYAHMDTGPISVIELIKKSFPNHAQEILRQRIRAVNVWKPLMHPVDEWSLAVCDGTTVDRKDLMETDSIRQGSVSTNYYVYYSEKQKWYFLQRQQPDEALIFKHFDSQPELQAPYALHSSIRQHTRHEDAKPRKSIEVRTLILSGKFPVPGDYGNEGHE